MQPGQHVSYIPAERQKFWGKLVVYGVRNSKCQQTKKGYFIYILVNTVPQRIMRVHFNRAGSTSQTSSSKSIYKATDHSTPSGCSKLIQRVSAIETWKQVKTQFASSQLISSASQLIQANIFIVLEILHQCFYYKAFKTIWWCQNFYHPALPKVHLTNRRKEDKFHVVICLSALEQMCRMR